jgi:hypothetical protein
MDVRLLDIILGTIGFFVLLVLIAVLPLIFGFAGIPAGFAYLTAIIGFLFYMTGTGYMVNRTIT